MKIDLSQYQMKKKKSVNSTDLSESAYEYGALIKVTDSQGYWGVADLKPWPLLGDLTLEKEIETKGPLFRRGLILAEEDLLARKNNVHLLQNKPVENNWLATDFKSIEFLKSISGTLKIKCNDKMDQLLLFLTKLASYDVNFRLDFNGSLDRAEFDLFIYSLPSAIVKKIEYIEDPTAEITPEWLNWNKKIPLAVDFAKATGDVFENEKAWTYFIVKPSRQNAEEIISKCHQFQKKFTITSSMDHPVGLAHGLRYAQKLAQNPSGFLTLEIYETNDFNHYFEANENKLNFSKSAYLDFGIGMTKTLDQLAWTPL